MNKSHLIQGCKAHFFSFFFTFFHSSLSHLGFQRKEVRLREAKHYSAAMLFYLYGQIPLFFYFIWPNSHEYDQDKRQKPKAFLSPTSTADSMKRYNELCTDRAWEICGWKKGQTSNLVWMKHAFLGPTYNHWMHRSMLFML